MVSTAVILKSITKELRIESAVKLSEIETKWQEIFDKSISKHIYPVDIKNDTLVIKVDSPLWIQQLSFMKDELKERLKRFSPEFAFRDIVFKLGKLPTERIPVKNSNTGALDIEELLSKNNSYALPEWVEDLLNEVKDIYLQERIKNIIIFNLSNQKGGGR